MPSGFGGFNSRGGGGSYGAGGSYGFNPNPTSGAPTQTGGSNWMQTAGTILPWLAFLYGVYQDRRGGDGGFQAVPQTPEQKEMYEMARRQMEQMQGNNQAAFNLALPGAAAAPGPVDIDAMRRGQTGYRGPVQMNPADLQRILASTSNPSPTVSTTPPGSPQTPQGSTPSPSGPGLPNQPTPGQTPNPNQPAPQPVRGPGFETPGTNPYASVRGFADFLNANGVQGSGNIAVTWFSGQYNGPDKSQIQALWDKYLATLPTTRPGGG
jgi:hypothetical protein